MGNVPCDLKHGLGEFAPTSALTEDLRIRKQGSHVMVKLDRGPDLELDLEPDLEESASPSAGELGSESE